jgi:hypothetical protein
LRVGARCFHMSVCCDVFESWWNVFIDRFALCCCMKSLSRKQGGDCVLEHSTARFRYGCENLFMERLSPLWFHLLLWYWILFAVWRTFGLGSKHNRGCIDNTMCDSRRALSSSVHRVASCIIEFTSRTIVCEVGRKMVYVKSNVFCELLR